MKQPPFLQHLEKQLIRPVTRPTLPNQIATLMHTHCLARMIATNIRGRIIAVWRHPDGY
jgi:hypothetical protein